MSRLCLVVGTLLMHSPFSRNVIRLEVTPIITVMIKLEVTPVIRILKLVRMLMTFGPNLSVRAIMPHL